MDQQEPYERMSGGADSGGFERGARDTCRSDSDRSEMAENGFPWPRADTRPRDDAWLMGAVGRGDELAYAELVQRHLPPVYRIGLRMLGDRDEAEDAAQESLVRLWQCAPNWRPLGGGLSAWLHRVATNVCLDRLRARRLFADGDMPLLPDESRDAAQMICTGELERLLGACLQRLPDGQRAALVLTYYEELSNGAAASAMSLKLKAFESLLGRARRRMSQELRTAGILSEDIELLA